MNNSQTFTDFLENLKIKNFETISSRYHRITRVLNSEYYGIDNDSSHSLYVGSIGRKTAINKKSDIDMLFWLPAEEFASYNSYETNSQSALLQDVKKILKKTYSSTEMSGDGQVVVISFDDGMTIELVPCFEKKDGSFIYPDTHDGGSWKKTNPRSEINAIKDLNNDVDGHLRNVCKMLRAWKNKNGVSISGLLIDTLIYNFVEANKGWFKNQSCASYDTVCKEVFYYLSKLDDTQSFWLAPGSSQQVNNKGKFAKKAKKAYDKVLEAIQKKENKTVNEIWRDIFGNVFPANPVVLDESRSGANHLIDTEQFIEDMYPVKIKYDLEIACNVSKNGFRKMVLHDFLKLNVPIGNSLEFYIAQNNVPKPYKVFWKVRNVGPEAIRRNNLRGEITRDFGNEKKTENSLFIGPHYVECYIIKNGICVARNRLDVPIKEN